MSRLHRAAVLFVLGGAALTACATKSDIQDLQADLALTKAEAGRRDAARATQLAEVIRMQQAILDSVQASNRAMGRLKGDMANDLYNIQQQLVQIQELTGQSQRRLTELKTQLEAREAQLQAAPPSDPAPVSGVAPSSSSAGSAAQMYQASLDQFNRGSLSTARAGFEQLVAQFPSSDQVPAALYYIGRSFTAEGPDSAANLESSAAYFERVVNEYPNSVHAPSALFYLGQVAEQRKDAAGAKKFYQRVVEKYPGSNEAGLAREKLKAPRKP